MTVVDVATEGHPLETAPVAPASPTAAERQAALEELLYAGPSFLPFVRSFAILMVLSVTIASFGLIGDSSPVVVGAMLIAPLMTPILGLAASLVLARPIHQARMLGIVAAAAAASVGLAWVVAWIIPTPTLSNELLSRTQPTLLDVFIGLTAGVAGAYVILNPKVSSSLPGVAIAVALIPPLSAVGVLAERNEPRLAMEAMLLFLTNLATITLASAVVFAASALLPFGGLPPARRLVRRGIALALLAVVIIAIPLGVQSARLVREATQREAVQSTVMAWVDAAPLEIDSIAIVAGSPTNIAIGLSGSSGPPSPDSLAAALAGRLGEPVAVTVTFTLRTDASATAVP